MSARFTVKPGERGLVWVFAVDLEGAELKRFTRQNGAWPVEEALGVSVAAPENVEIFPLSDLGELGLAGYLEEGMGIPPQQVAEAGPALNGLKGTVLVLSSRAFGPEGAEFTPRAPLRYVASFSEECPLVQFEPLRSEAAVGTAGTQTEPDLPPSQRLRGKALVIAALVAALAVALMLFTGGNP